MVQLHQEKQADVVCLSFNLDFIGDEPPLDETRLKKQKEKVALILKKYNALFRTVLSTEADTVVYEEIGLAAIPATLVFDSTGKLSKRFDNDSNEYGPNGYSFESQVIPHVEALLKEQ